MQDNLPLHQDMPTNVSKGAQKLLNKMFVKLPEYRISAA